MTSNLHPSYPFPIIREVVCEIHFRLDTDMEWDISWYSDFFKRVEEFFPIFEPVLVPPSLTEQSDGGSSIVFPQVIRYRHGSRSVFLQLSENRISINVLPIYPGWKQVYDDISYAWNKLYEIVHPSKITRVGLRYINAIELAKDSDTLGTWLIPSPYIPSTLLQSREGFGAQISKIIDNENRIQVIIAHQSSRESNFGVFLLDIDRVTERIINADLDLLLENATELHNDVWDVFASTKGVNLERLMKGDLA